MSESYSPGPGANLQPPYTTVFLSQRDLSLRTPINFVTTPGVSLSAACFPHRRYEDDQSGDCLSNLLAVGFRRFEIDLYWDEGRQVWSFCPVTIPTFIPNANPGSTATLLFSSTAVSSASSESQSSSADVASAVNARQISTGILSASTTTPTTLASSLGTLLPSVSILPDSPNDPVIAIGSFTCSTTINLSVLTSQLLDYIQKTETTLDAHLLYVIINVHAAASNTAPLSPAPLPTSLPQPPNLLGDLFSSNLSAYLYTPANLRSDRADIGQSWYRVDERYRPIEDFYTTSTNQYGVISTEDGWPSESYIELSNSKRLLLSYGNIDPQMANYNFSGDESVIFPAGYLQSNPNVDASTSGELTQGCFFHNNSYDLAQTNSSWATAANIPGFAYPSSNGANITSFLNLTANTTDCGISPILNVTLLNASAHDNFQPYQQFTYATIWSWASGEPKNDSSNADEASDSLFRCAAMHTDLNGRWAVSDCSSKYYAACRGEKQPYNWTITSYSISYSFADQACDEGYDFAVPRTALENSYLQQAILSSKRDYDGHGVWIDFNSLNYEACWTSGGPNATCPYLEGVQLQDDLHRKFVLVPTVAALIVLIVTTLTIFVKAAGRSQVRKRNKRRGYNKLVYEGVPS